jgi:hypothetical protein
LPGSGGVAYDGVASPWGPVSDRPRVERGWRDCPACGAVGTDPSSPLCTAGAGLPAPTPGDHVAGRGTAAAGPSGTLCLAGARLPAQAAAAEVRTTVAAVAPTAAVPTGDFSSGGVAGGPVPARDTYTSAAATRDTCRDAGIPPTAPSPRPAARPPDGDAARGWYPVAPGPGGHARGLAGLSGTLLRPHHSAGPPLVSGDGGVRGARRQPDVGSGAPSARCQRRHRQVDLDAQAVGRWYPGAVQGSLGSSGLHSAPRSRLRRDLQPGSEAGHRPHGALAGPRSLLARSLTQRQERLPARALTETVYCCQAAGFVDSSRPDMVCRLNRSFYGLKQAPRAWHSRLASFLVTLDFVEAKSDTSLFIHHHGAETAYLLLYVDDIVLTASSQSLLCASSTRFSGSFRSRIWACFTISWGSLPSLTPLDSYFTSGSTLLTFWSGPI